MEISELLAFSVKNKASDLHLSAGLPPMIRVHGDIRRINVPALNKGSPRHGVRHHERLAAQAVRSTA
jgi:Tfp pilus assembly pilus retraction ATPase PilT